MSQNFEKVTHCLFDMDGLLLNTEFLYTKLIQQTIEEFGSSGRYTSEMKVSMMGCQSLELARRIIEIFQLNVTPEEYHEKHVQLGQKIMPTAELLPGVERLLRHLHKHDIPIALATSSSKELYDMKTEKHDELFGLFHHKVYGSSDAEVVNGKPSPDIFIVAASRFPDQPDPKQCLVFEDAPNGVKAAIAANCQCVMVPEDYVTADLRKEATLVLNSLEEFRPELFGLPPFDD
ncbi:hypothetical protein HA402_012732 [Bradysia odoriphaga]|nr:hypothetical protein HA402_012732 [Bradysia odoriphaga]